MKARMMFLKNAFTPLALMCMATLPMATSALAGSSGAVAQTKAPAYDVPDGAFSFFGQTIDPTAIAPIMPNSWGEVKKYVPSLFPDAQTSTLSKEQLCDFMVKITRGYGAIEESTWYLLAYDIKPYFPEIKEEPLLVDEVAKRLHSDDMEVFGELMTMMEGDEQKVITARTAGEHFHAATYLKDAALNNCPEYAAQKGYIKSETVHKENMEFWKKRGMAPGGG